MNSKMDEKTKTLSLNWQAFLVRMIETSSFIDEEPYWEYYTLLTADPKVVGFCTVYNNYITKDVSRV
jgi:hypothetical protein